MDGMLKKAILLLCPLIWLGSNASAETNHTLRSPDRRIEVRVQAGDRIRYSILLNGRSLLQDSTLSILIDHRRLGFDAKEKAAKERSVNQEIEPQVRQKFARIRENYNELRLEMEGDYAVVFRAYNEGAAYRFETSLPQSEVRVYEEEVSLNFADDYRVYYPKEDSFFSHNEREFVYLPLKDTAATSIASLPAVVDATDGIKVCSRPDLFFVCGSRRSHYRGPLRNEASDECLPGKW